MNPRRQYDRETQSLRCVDWDADRQDEDDEAEAGDRAIGREIDQKAAKE